MFDTQSAWLHSDEFTRPAGKFFTMFHFLEYPFSRGSTHIKSADPYETPDFDCGFMNDERDVVPMVWGYIKSRETARRMDAYAGEVETMVRCPFIINCDHGDLSHMCSTLSLTMTLLREPMIWI